MSHKKLLFQLSRKYLRASLFFPELYGNIVSQDYAIQSISSPAARAILNSTIDFLTRCHYGQLGENEGESELAGELRALFNLHSSTRSLINAKGVCDSRFYCTGDCTCPLVQDCLTDFMRYDGLPLSPDIPYPDDNANPGSVAIYEYWTNVPVRNIARTTNL